MRARHGDRIVAFDHQDPTTEVLAKSIHDVVARELAGYSRQPDTTYPLRPSVRLVSVRVWETATSWAEFSTA
jgi:6-pyruvoyltetrahydropterin/6-carboxytetrahydropterin synthase